MISSRSERLVSTISASRLRCGNDLQLPVQRLGAFAEFVFVFQAGIEALEVGPVPQHVRLLADRDPA